LPGWAFIAWFFFWRMAYNLLMGLLLYHQSNSFAINKWLERNQGSSMQRSIKKAIISEMGSDYDYDKVPIAFNAYMLFRIIADVVLGNDLLSYLVFALKFYQTPDFTSIWTFIAYISGILMCIFSLWAKLDSYRVVKDYAWYWGDFFFTIEQKLMFDRVFAMFPHPMYTVG
jgi:phosphatidylethanolamine N-methyltransferase